MVAWVVWETGRSLCFVLVLALCVGTLRLFVLRFFVSFFFVFFCTGKKQNCFFCTGTRWCWTEAVRLSVLRYQAALGEESFDVLLAQMNCQQVLIWTLE